MPKKLRRHFLKGKQGERILEEASRKLGVNFEKIFKKKMQVELLETEFAEFFIINGKLALARKNGKIFPTLIFKEFFSMAPKIIVDMGAVPYVCNGANVMAPGIVRFEGKFKKGDIVLVVDEKYGKPLAVGEACSDISEAERLEHGVVVKNIHFVGDKLWNFMKEIMR